MSAYFDRAWLLQKEPDYGHKAYWWLVAISNSNLDLPRYFSSHFHNQTRRLFYFELSWCTVQATGISTVQHARKHTEHPHGRFFQLIFSTREREGECEQCKQTPTDDVSTERTRRDISKNQPYFVVPPMCWRKFGPERSSQAVCYLS